MRAGEIEMGKALTVAKWFLNVLLVLMVVGTVLYAFNIVWTGIQGEWQVVSLPVAAAPRVSASEAQAVAEAAERTGEPDDGLRGTSGSIENDELGVGQVMGTGQEAWFTVHPFGRAGLLYNLALVIAAVPAFVLAVLLRKIVGSAAAGEPFTNANVKRVRAIGALTIVAELARGLAILGSEAFVQRTSTSPDLLFMVNGRWNFAVLILGVVILALAEVFRYGMQLQADADLTV